MGSLFPAGRARATAPFCEVGTTWCPFSAYCADLQSDPINCGHCGIECSVVYGARGICCNGTCIDRDSDDANCGECGHACQATHGPGGICCGGRCFDRLVDTDHCGACGRDCDAGDGCV